MNWKPGLYLPEGKLDPCIIAVMYVALWQCLDFSLPFLPGPVICLSVYQSVCSSVTSLSPSRGVLYPWSRRCPCPSTGFSTHSPWNLSEKPVTQCILDEVFWCVIKMGSTGGGNGKPSQYICCENFMSCIKGPKDESPRCPVCYWGRLQKNYQ